MAVYKNKYNLWSCKGKFKDANGDFKNYHRFANQNGFKLKKEAVMADHKIREELNEMGRYVPAHQLTFKGLCEEYLNEKKRVLKYSTIYADTKILKRAEVMNGLLLKEITPKAIQQILDTMDKEGLSLNYIGRFSDTLNKIFKYAVDKEYIWRNPMDKVIRIKRPNVVQKKDMNFWEPQDFKKFIENEHFYSSANTSIFLSIIIYAPMLSLFMFGLLSMIIKESIFNNLKYILLISIYALIAFWLTKINLNAKKEGPFYKKEIEESIKRLDSNYYKQLLMYVGIEIRNNCYYLKNSLDVFQALFL